MEPSPPESDSGHDPQNEQSDSEERRFLRRFLKPGYAIIFVVLLVVSAVMAGYGHYTDPGPLPENKIILIPRGSVKVVGRVLQDNNVLSAGQVSSLFFQFIVKITAKGGALQAAEFSFPSRVSIAHVLEILRHGKAVSHNITIAEGLTAAQINRIFQNDSLLKGDMPPLVEGTVFPQTYSYQRDAERRTVLGRMQHLMTLTVEKQWEERDKKALEGIIGTPRQLVILASLIERETSIAAERPRVARVFLNRLKKGMKLQTDPTVIYALTHGEGALDHPLSREDLQIDSPYNTYRNTGLPPNPICSPGLSSLQAAAHPAEGAELYFVATGQGGHNFSKTLEEHSEHVRAYRRFLMANP